MPSDHIGPGVDRPPIPMHPIERRVQFSASVLRSSQTERLRKARTRLRRHQMLKMQRRRQDIVNKANGLTDNYIAPRAPWCYSAALLDSSQLRNGMVEGSSFVSAIC